MTLSFTSCGEDQDSVVQPARLVELADDGENCSTTLQRRVDRDAGYRDRFAPRRTTVHRVGGEFVEDVLHRVQVARASEDALPVLRNKDAVRASRLAAPSCVQRHLRDRRSGRDLVFEQVDAMRRPHGIAGKSVLGLNQKPLCRRRRGNLVREAVPAPQAEGPEVLRQDVARLRIVRQFGRRLKRPRLRLGHQRSPRATESTRC